MTLWPGLVMKLSDLGFDQWFEAHISELHQAGRGIARISAVDRGSYLIRNETREVPAELAGKLSYQTESSVDLPCVGDWVTVQYYNDDTEAIIHGVFPRKTFLRRKTAGGNVDFQMIAANIDSAFIVQSCHFDFNPRRMDRYLVMAADGNVEPVVILTKTDLITPGELEQMLAVTRSTAISARVLALSNISGIGFDEFQRYARPGKNLLPAWFIGCREDNAYQPLDRSGHFWDKGRQWNGRRHPYDCAQAAHRS